jgi:hypothetical protein
VSGRRLAGELPLVEPFSIRSRYVYTHCRSVATFINWIHWDAGGCFSLGRFQYPFHFISSQYLTLSILFLFNYLSLGKTTEHQMMRTEWWGTWETSRRTKTAALIRLTDKRFGVVGTALTACLGRVWWCTPLRNDQGQWTRKLSHDG